MSSHKVTLNYYKGMLAIEERKFHEAIEILENEPSGSPCFTLSHGNIALAHLGLENFTNAEQEGYDTLILIEKEGCPHPPSHVQFMRNLGESISRQNRQAEAIVVYNKACHLADELIRSCPDDVIDIELEKAHTMNAWGAALLNTESWSPSIDCFNKARAIYKKYRDYCDIGIAETLTNLALAYMRSSKALESEYAFYEALSIAESKNDQDQINRIMVGLKQLEPQNTAGYYDLFDRTIANAIARGLLDTAYKRLCIAATEAKELGHLDKGLEYICQARGLEGSIGIHNVRHARLRFLEATLLDINDTERIVKTLIEGAYIWYECLIDVLSSPDFYLSAKEMHDHFRLLSRYLLNKGYVKQALLSFELGNALKYLHDADLELMNKLVKNNPFKYDGSIDIEILNSIINTIEKNSSIIVICILPPQIVAFIINQNDVDCVAVQLPKEQNEIRKLHEDIEMTPHRLSSGVKERAIPQLLMELGKLIKEKTETSTITGIIPYAGLHFIPWRTVFAYNGITFDRIKCSVSFHLLFRLFHNCNALLGDTQAIAMGHGYAEDYNLEKEAELFIEQYKNGYLIECTKAQIGIALVKDCIIFISCHGETEKIDNKPKLKLKLRDEDAVLEDILPKKVVSPLIILSACESGVYNMEWGDYPSGVAPLLIEKGACWCIITRYPISARYAKAFFSKFSESLRMCADVKEAFRCATIDTLHKDYDLWKDVSCIELLGKV